MTTPNTENIEKQNDFNYLTVLPFVSILEG